MDKHFSKFNLVIYSLPAIAMMIAVSAYSFVNGFFLSNYAGPTAFAAENLIWPLIMIFSTVGLMVGTGSSALIANKLGEKDKGTARRYFSMFVYFAIILGIVLTFVCFALVEPVAILLGAKGELLDLSIYYGHIMSFSIPGYLLQMAFMVYFNTAGKPNMGFITAIICTIIILILDIILVVFLSMGIDGVLIALTCTIYVGAIFPFIYFARSNNKSYLHLVSPKIAFKNENPNSIALLIRASINGSSETVQDIAISLVSLLCIYQINVFYGDDGIVAYGVTEYAWLVFNSLFIGFSMASAPLMSYQQGAKNKHEMHSLFKNCMTIIVIFSVVSFAISQLCAEPLVVLFVGYSTELVDFSVYVFRIYAISFMFFGISIYGSSLFTSLGNGLISALIAFLRTIVFEVIALIILPMIFAGDGIWYAAIFAEIMSAILTIIFIITKGKKYGILKKG